MKSVPEYEEWLQRRDKPSEGDPRELPVPTDDLRPPAWYDMDFRAQHFLDSVPEKLRKKKNEESRQSS